MSARLAGVVLAGGRSSRMGVDKAFVTLAGRPLVEHAVARLAPQVAWLAINSNADPAGFAHLDRPVLADRITGFRGPLAGILAGLEWAETLDGCDGMVTVAVDTPFFPADLVSRLADAAAEGSGAVVAASGGRRHPTFALWPLDAAERLRRHFAAEGSARVIDFIDAHPNATVEFDLVGACDPFFNLNRPDDLISAERIASTMT